MAFIKDLKEEPATTTKEEFRKYLSERLKSASRYMAVLDKRVREYIHRLVSKDADSIFSFTTTEEVEMCIAKLEDSDEFNIANEKSHGLMRAALHQYLSFTTLTEIEQGKHVSHYENYEIALSCGEDVEFNRFEAGHCINIQPKRSERVRPAFFNYFPKLFKKHATEASASHAYSSIFSPAEVKRDSHLLISIFLHLEEETELAISMAKEADTFATRRDYIPLPLNLLNIGDKLDIQLSINGKTQLFFEKRTVIWQGSITKCRFAYYVPSDLNENDLYCRTVLCCNEIPLGEMSFITRIVEQPMALYPKVNVHPYEKIFISYAHQDEATVKHYATAYQLLQKDCFFDRAYLKAGDIFPKEIEKFINSADLFILFWSENAAQSDYVKKEVTQALRRAYPQVQPYEKAKLRISPISIAPQADLPANMKGTYHFEIVS